MKKKNEEGFTLMETLVSIALLLICGTAVGQIVFTLSRSAVAAREKSTALYRMLRMERIIRETAEGITIPYWEKEEASIKAADAALQSVLAQAEEVFQGAAEKTEDAALVLEELRDPAGHLRGIRGRWRSAERDHESGGLFASMPVTGGAE
jgi:prepilin-type N-terminal cleavage/methylation domain-containing protein